MTKRKKLTPKQRVLKKWPNAFCMTSASQIFARYGIFLSVLGNHIGKGNTPNAAWADAARRLK